MGTWGSDIFDDDFAMDIKGNYKEFLDSGLSHETTTNNLIRQYQDVLEDPEDSSIFWLALAAIQLEYGITITNVRNNAIRVIDSNQDLMRWTDSPDANERKRKLDKLKERLLQ